MKATVTSKGQITIPLAIRRKLKLHQGSVLEFDPETDFLKATKSADREIMRGAIGLGKKALAGKSVDEWLSLVRGPVEIPRAERLRRRS